MEGSEEDEFGRRSKLVGVGCERKKRARRPVECLLSRMEETPSFHVGWRHRQASSCVPARTHAALRARQPRWTGAP